MNDVSRILSEIGPGDPAAAERLLPLVYDELRRLAAAWMANERADYTLDATALVHEAYLRLVGDQHFEGRAHFFAAAAEIVKLRFFAGMTLDEAARALQLSLRTANRKWGFARAWLAWLAAALSRE
jgi:DNA-directed RNA polymerase specialized sigma24 family protein